MSHQLNERQREAVNTVSSPMLVLAGAGSGKTSVITTKIAHLITQCGYKASQIAAVTFTNKAAREMKERVTRLLAGQGGRGLTVSTFHNLGLNIIRREHKSLGFKSNFTIFDDQDTLTLLRDLCNKNAEADKSELVVFQQKISSWKNDLKSPQEVINAISNQDDLAAAKVYEAYDRSMRAYNAVDFDDLIRYPVELFRAHPDVLERWQNKIRYLLVDEYQDTNTCQYELVKLICGRFGLFTVVGDDDQSIYSWRGAQPENLALLKEDFPNLKIVKLEQNYRSYGRILKVANEVIAHNPHVFDKKLWSDKNYGDPIRVLATDDDLNESERIANELLAHKLRNTTQYSDYAILYRGNHQSRFIEKALLEKQIPYKVSGSTSFFARTEIKDVMAYLRLLVNQDDDNAFLRIVNVPRREIGPNTLEKLGLYAQRRHISLYESCFELGLEQELPAKGYAAIQRFANLISRAEDNAKRGDTIAVINELFAYIGYHGFLYDNSSSPKAAEFRWANVQQLLEWVERELENFEDEEFPLARAINKLILREMLDRNEEDSDNNEVQLMTLHASKGLEFNHVFLVGMEEELLPHRSSIEEDNIEEERRLAYVGITRAQKTLTLSYARQRKRYGETVDTEPSRFLFEMPQDELIWEEQQLPMSEEERQEKGRRNMEQLRAMLT
ncbi:DNA helicase Rep [Pleionea sediminis]|uniref:DNA helicase Rep n=1 Tax=Pleionea sediminis TaxID=2569479 RepID=UPI0011848430|nr:DNA helicase Rep [Pleionea sediminis]